MYLSIFIDITHLSCLSITETRWLRSNWTCHFLKAQFDLRAKDKPNVVENTECNKRLPLNFIVENLIICFTLYRKWLALTEVVIQLLKINQKIRSLLHAEEIIDVTLDISWAYQLTDYSLQ